MKVLSGAVPIPDDAHPEESLRRMYTYLFDLAEQVDYTLARQGLQLGRGSLPATAQQVDKLTTLTDGLTSTVTALSAQVTAMEAKVDAMEAKVDAMKPTDTSAILARLGELELNAGMHVTEYNDLLEMVQTESSRTDDLEYRVEEIEAIWM